MREFKPQATHYSIPITMEEYDKYDDTELEWKDTLAAAIDKLDGLYNTDYNGHFGLFVFVRIDAEHDTPETKQKICDLMKEHAKQTKRVCTCVAEEADGRLYCPVHPNFF